MWFKIKSYILFLLKSTNKHGVHSPFVYNLVTKCFNLKTDNKKILVFNKIKQYFKNDESIINVTDYGKGSKIFKSNYRKISEIAKFAGISNQKAFLLIRLIEYFNSKSILELGTSVGISSAAISLGNSKATITTLEGCGNTAIEAKKMFELFNFNNINLITGEFRNTLKPILNKNTFDLIYFDGNHQKESTLNYFNQCIEGIHNNTVFIFDDINWSNEMNEAWGEIKNHPKVKVTIDVYFWGIVFFRKEQVKQHFTIRA